MMEISSALHNIISSKSNTRIEFIECPYNETEIRYFADKKDTRYLSWKIPNAGIYELVDWWSEFRTNKNPVFPLQVECNMYQFTMLFGSKVFVRECSPLGSLKINAWSIPVEAVEKTVQAE